MAGGLRRSGPSQLHRRRRNSIRQLLMPAGGGPRCLQAEIGQACFRRQRCCCSRRSRRHRQRRQVGAASAGACCLAACRPCQQLASPWSPGFSRPRRLLCCCRRRWQARHAAASWRRFCAGRHGACRQVLCAAVVAAFPAAWGGEPAAARGEAERGAEAGAVSAMQ